MTTAVGKPITFFQAHSTEGMINSKTWQHWTVLYFYPKDMTPGCTRESEDFRDNIKEFNQRQCRVFGVSRDSLVSHERFCKKLELPFPLISDSNEHICQLFDVIKTKNNYGKISEGIERSTFLIDPENILRFEWRKVKVDGHGAAVLQKLKEFQDGK